MRAGVFYISLHIILLVDPSGGKALVSTHSRHLRMLGTCVEEPFMRAEATAVRRRFCRLRVLQQLRIRALLYLMVGSTRQTCLYTEFRMPTLPCDSLDICDSLVTCCGRETLLNGPLIRESITGRHGTSY